MKNEELRQLPFRLDAMVLVCKACGKRSSGPAKEGKPKKLAQALKGAARQARLKTRVVMTSCMGLCPKKATAVVVIGSSGDPVQYAVESRDQAASLIQRRLPAPPAETGAEGSPAG
jgi:predicted metal-binding protein